MVAKRKKITAIISFLLILIVLISCIIYDKKNEEPKSQVSADSLYEFTIVSNALIIDKYVGNNDYVVVPSKINNMRVSDIGVHAFSGNQSIKEIVIEDGIDSIEYSAFENCINLVNVKLPNSITSISSNVFRNCTNLENINLPDSIKYIGDSAFEGCKSLRNITLPKSLTGISARCFKDSALKEIHIEEGVERIGDGAFSGCNNLKSVTIPSTVKRISLSSFPENIHYTINNNPYIESYLSQMKMIQEEQKNK